MFLQSLARLRAPVRPKLGTLLTGVALALLAAFAGPSPSASAHPFGPPSTAKVRVQGSRLLLAWNTDKLDWVILGKSLEVFNGEDSGGTSSGLSFAQRLERSPAIRAYLLKHIAVSQAGRPCPGTVVGAMKDFLAQGAQLAFDCPAPVTEVDVTIKALTDLHPAYRTMLTSEGPSEAQQTLFTSAEPTTRVRFTASGGGVQKTVVAFAIGTFVAALSAVTFAVWRSRRRKAARAGDTTLSASAFPATSAATPVPGPGTEAVTNAITGTGTRSNA
ncbi:hypothetical protein ABZ890_44060 [Streptomyces sp. NPDC046984]|uniref:hypothetical protein n=1 Tax=Streptomyces sp. NPDC046984 TaxID=3155138 RepID=UPI0033E104E1